MKQVDVPLHPKIMMEAYQEMAVCSIELVKPEFIVEFPTRVKQI